MPWRQDELPELVRAMADRPHYEGTRGHVAEIAVDIPEPHSAMRQ